MADVRVIAATNRDLETLVEEGRFRQDLYYRLNVVRIQLPPLSGRREDIPLLVEHFIRSFNLKKGKHIAGVTGEVMDLLMGYEYPGNVRELENIVEHAFVLCHSTQIGMEHLPRELAGPVRSRADEAGVTTDPLGRAEARTIREMLRRMSGHRGRTARALGIHPTTLWRKMKRLGIEDE
jgi:transcriptional regulator with PAS, ATPase and Fis domain